MDQSPDPILSTAEHRAIAAGWNPGRAKPMDGPRLLIYSQDGLGLGHLRRTTSLANEFLRVSPDGAVLTMSDSPLGTFFGMAPNHDYLKLPSLVKFGTKWHALSLPMSTPELLGLRRDLIASTAASFRPDILLVDHMPHGACGELLATLDRLSGTSTKVALGLRDILDAPEVTSEVWEREGAYDAVERYYEQVLVYGSRDVFDVAQEYRWPGAAGGRLRYCGYVCTPDPPRNARRIRARCLNGSGNSQLIVAMAGGGADAYPLMDNLLEALPVIYAQVPCSLVIITGPFMPAALRRDLATRALGLPALVRTSVPDVPSYIAAADVVVAMAGYNTTTEVLRSQRPAVMVPRRGPSSEQRMRARLFAERGWVGLVEPDDLSASALAQAVLGRFESRREPPPTKPDFRGLTVAVRHLRALLDDRPSAPASDSRAVNERGLRLLRAVGGSEPAGSA